MTDLEIVKKCAEKMGETVKEYNGYLFFHGPTYNHHQHQQHYNPLHDDAQAMALVKRFKLVVDHFSDGDWLVHTAGDDYRAENADLNRAICECVAKLP